MLEGQGKPLEIAKRVLSSETLMAVSRSPFNLRGWKILDRWALNTPKALRELEGKGIEALTARLLEQQRVESEAVLERPEALAEGLTEHEVLLAAEVETELK